MFTVCGVVGNTGTDGAMGTWNFGFKFAHCSFVLFVVESGHVATRVISVMLPAFFCH